MQHIKNSKLDRIPTSPFPLSPSPKETHILFARTSLLTAASLIFTTAIGGFLPTTAQTLEKQTAKSAT
ncbi:MAG: hypothetical protein AAGI45_20530, partial [Cyanobacteria bacterium P01_H01_bin.26]